MEFMRKAVQRFEVQLPEKPDAKIEAHKDLILRWSNPTTSVKDGSLGVFCQEGRPVVYVELQLHNAQRMIHEFARLTPDPVKVQRKDGPIVWMPEGKGWSDFKPLASSEKPSEKPTVRLTQMRRLAKKFRVVDHFGWNDKDIQVQNLRLMPTPAYRYGKTGDVVDGAVFVFSQGTNPEAILTLEAHGEGEDAAWRYVLTPSSIYQLQAYIGDELVWDKPRYIRFGTQRGPYFAFPYVRHPEDDNLKGAFPKDKK